METLAAYTAAQMGVELDFGEGFGKGCGDRFRGIHFGIYEVFGSWDSE